jgi:hypothetical protein
MAIERPGGMGSVVRFVHTPTALVDRHVGLDWEPQPGDAAVTWAEAQAAAAASGWRLPTASELLSFLGDAPADAIWLPPAGATFWSATMSPFARASRVRGVAREAGGRFVVVLLDRDERARRWGVRSAARRIPDLSR